MIRRYIIWRNNYLYDERLRRVINRAALQPDTALETYDRSADGGYSAALNIAI